MKIEERIVSKHSMHKYFSDLVKDTKAAVDNNVSLKPLSLSSLLSIDMLNRVQHMVCCQN